MAFHTTGDYALYFGLDGGTNKLSVGGWSMGAVSHEIYHAGNKPSLATLGYTGHNNATYVTNNNQLTNGAGYITSGDGYNANLLDGFDSTNFLRNDGWDTNPGQNANTQSSMKVDFTYSNNAPHTGPLIRLGQSSYDLQLNSTYNSNNGGLSFRSHNGDNTTWTTWQEIFHTGHPPTLAEVGFTGASNANYITNNNQLTNGAGYVTTSEIGRAHV